MFELHALIRMFGQQLDNIRGRQNEAMKPFEDERRALYAQLNALRINRRSFLRAIAVREGTMEEDRLGRDPLARMYLEVLRENGQEEALPILGDGADE